MSKEKALCPHCGASMMEHRHTLSEALVTGLTKLAEQRGPVNLQVLNLTRNQWDNFQKLRYWDLVSQVTDAEGRRQNGVWAITDHGRAFLRGWRVVPHAVWTYRGQRVRYEDGETVGVHDVLPGYRYRLDYAEDAQPHSLPLFD